MEISIQTEILISIIEKGIIIYRMVDLFMRQKNNTNKFHVSQNSGYTLEMENLSANFVAQLNFRKAQSEINP